MRRRVRLVGIVASAVALVWGGAGSASGVADHSMVIHQGCALHAVIYISPETKKNRCRAFEVYASTNKEVRKLTHTVEWDPVGLGATATVKRVGVNVSGNSSVSSVVQFDAKNVAYLGVKGDVCASWSPLCLGAFSSGSIKIEGTYLVAMAHV